MLFMVSIIHFAFFFVNLHVILLIIYFNDGITCINFANIDMISQFSFSNHLMVREIATTITKQSSNSFTNYKLVIIKQGRK